jgi:hypothetical protein|mmetsp:Transcript_86784/g.144823  ORF Transcript_86784/g.144823 Transcript_86784/m.144823 type:complete len:275 (-) Transcript_86784:79-903(-)|eukprot:CAMPEP_0174288310 /NCGR_PEP_ID=MMETSP0809-20121228/20030_1 /TAXON_ID=73025 ORGANISM="Eutreptiella gymnastica-like, Strain CCMP1594" /NCGR_SAMPLE_ID=MMETSP0809 /ASSEMBLY_ACC=CAM_ASM_000658 /LENGTH=274 /DNA_ID=CAMNT_0015385401 /DNA_START=61 /DNA_END=885 /DNA_ORIENTATION=+
MSAQETPADSVRPGGATPVEEHITCADKETMKPKKVATSPVSPTRSPRKRVIGVPMFANTLSMLPSDPVLFEQRPAKKVTGPSERLYNPNRKPPPALAALPPQTPSKKVSGASPRLYQPPDSDRERKREEQAQARREKEDRKAKLSSTPSEREEAINQRIYYGPVKHSKDIGANLEAKYNPKPPPPVKLRADQQAEYCSRMYTDRVERLANNHERLKSKYLRSGSSKRLTQEEVAESVVRLYEKPREQQRETIARLVEEHVGPEARQQLRFSAE